MFKIAPLGKLLNPFIGLVQNRQSSLLDKNRVFSVIPHLNKEVQVFYDERKVPHIYAKNLDDLYFAQGYIAASLRLWQMDFTSYASAGRLSEIFSDGFLNYDRSQRRIGILTAAKKSLEFISHDAQTIRVLNAYSKGVNAYINELDYKALPIEYKLLDYYPEKWTNLKSVLIMKQLSNTLSGYEEDSFMSNIILALGESKFNQLFPEFDSHINPIIRSRTLKPSRLVNHIKIPDYLNYSFLTTNSSVPDNHYNPKLGSNSWVVSKEKTKSGFPILANDPHLNLSLPNIWLETQLTCNELNVYGVSIPGVPSIIIGFNKDVAWGITSGADDVKDWYKLKITGDYKKYEMDGKWLDLSFKVEKIIQKNKPAFLDTVYESIHGPIVNDRSYDDGTAVLSNYALHWQLHEPSNELKTFVLLNNVKDYQGFRNAINNYWCPIQNFTFACKDNSIALYHQGKMEIKTAGQGKFILDGTRSDLIPSKYVPFDDLPHLVNPTNHFLFSANQRPTDASYPYYYNGYYSEMRAKRLKQLLENENDFDVLKMEKIQLDNKSAFAQELLPILEKHLAQTNLTNDEMQFLREMFSWNCEYNASDVHAIFFDLWWGKVRDLTWDEFKYYKFTTKLPSPYTLLDLIKSDPKNLYFDIQGTNAKESADDVIKIAFKEVYKTYKKIKGPKNWATFNKINIKHLTNIDAFSKIELPSSGSPDVINATSNSWGPSWRMIVQLGDQPKALGIYPGGQSGDVGSKYYDNFIEDWNKGKYYQLHFYLSENEAKINTSLHWYFK
jgi:penicillin amidase